MLDQYQDKVFRLACGMLGNETIAQDIAQEVFMKIWKALPTYRAGASPSSWIYTITRNTCLTELRKSRTGQKLSLAEEAVQTEVDQQTMPAAAAGLEMDVQALLTELPEHYRHVLVLFYLEQKSYGEVAAMLGLPMGTVKTHLHRAKKELMRLTAQRKETYA
jgi:RNA polymerase sigma-70 factor (ECF subfamily)